MVWLIRGRSLEKRLRTILGGKSSKDIVRFGAELESPRAYPEGWSRSSEDPVEHQGEGLY